uniref:Putative secreted protein n=1 Tax=Ixodes ricinus TaxID=34613 RepID=A0A6B0TWJ3_IXORI
MLLCFLFAFLLLFYFTRTLSRILVLFGLVFTLFPSLRPPVRLLVCYARLGHFEGRLQLCCCCCFLPLSSAITSYFRLRLSF